MLTLAQMGVIAQYTSVCIIVMETLISALKIIFNRKELVGQNALPVLPFICTEMLGVNKRPAMSNKTYGTIFQVCYP